MGNTANMRRLRKVVHSNHLKNTMATITRNTVDQNNRTNNNGMERSEQISNTVETDEDDDID